MERGSDSKPWHTCKTVIYLTCPLPPRKPIGARGQPYRGVPVLAVIIVRAGSSTPASLSQRYGERTVHVSCTPSHVLAGETEPTGMRR